MSRIGLLFGGQGQQVEGMDKRLENSNIFKEASDILGYDLASITQDSKLLNQTRYTQPALLTFNHGMYEMIKDKIKIDYVAGLSLGEYNALLASEVLSFSDALSIINKRASIMSSALPPYSSKMAAVLKGNKDIIEEVLSRSELNKEVSICNYNTSDQFVIGGKSDYVDKAVDLLKEVGCKRVIELPVSIASHISLLDEASEELELVLNEYEFNKPKISFINNIQGIKQEDGFVYSLSKHISNATHMSKCIVLMLNEGVDTFIEIAPKKALLSFVKSIAKEMNKDIKLYLINDIESLNEVLNEVKDSE